MATINNPGAQDNNEIPDNVVWIDRRTFIKNGLIFTAGAGTALGVREAAHYVLNREKKFFDREDVENHLEQSKIEWKSAGEVLNTVTRRCMDGREDQCSCCEPGGMIGGAVKRYAAVESITGRRFTPEEIDACFERELQMTPDAGSYAHIDEHTIHFLMHEMHITKRSDMEDLLKEPGERKEELRRALRKAPVCGHMTGLIQRTGSYDGVRPELPLAVMDSYYNRYWSPDRRISSKMEHRIVRNNHTEKAALILDGDGGEDEDTALVQPQRLNSSMFVVDKKMMRMSNRRFAQSASDIMHVPSRELDRNDLFNKLEELGDQHLNASVKALAPHHPIFQGRVDSRGRKIILAA